VHPASIVLVSDLETAPDDVPVLAQTVEELRQASIELRVVGLSPSSDARVIFEDVLQGGGVFDPGPVQEDGPIPGLEATSSLPLVLLVLGAALFGVLAAHELFGSRLAIPGGERRRA
jgi:hypothetical protein